jgi:hypothetical protein
MPFLSSAAAIVEPPRGRGSNWAKPNIAVTSRKVVSWLRWQSKTNPKIKNSSCLKQPNPLFKSLLIQQINFYLNHSTKLLNLPPIRVNVFLISNLGYIKHLMFDMGKI